MINHLKEDQFEKLRSAFPVQFSGCAERNAKAGRGKDREQESKRFEKCIRFPVTIAGGIHLFPYRTQKLSLHTLIVLGWKRPGRVGRRRIPLCWRNLRFSNTLIPEDTERAEARGNESGRSSREGCRRQERRFLNAPVRRKGVCRIDVGWHSEEEESSNFRAAGSGSF